MHYIELARGGVGGRAERMFIVPDADAAVIRAVSNEEGELSAAIEVRRRFPGLVDTEKARACVRTIAGWAAPLSTVTRFRPRKDA